MNSLSNCNNQDQQLTALLDLFHKSLQLNNISEVTQILHLLASYTFTTLQDKQHVIDSVIIPHMSNFLSPEYFKQQDLLYISSQLCLMIDINSLALIEETDLIRKSFTLISADSEFLKIIGLQLASHLFSNCDLKIQTLNDNFIDFLTSLLNDCSGFSLDFWLEYIKLIKSIFSKKLPLIFQKVRKVSSCKS